MQSNINTLIKELLTSKAKSSPILKSWFFTVIGRNLGVNVYGQSPERKLLATLIGNTTFRRLTITRGSISDNDLAFLVAQFENWEKTGQITIEIAPETDKN